MSAARRYLATASMGATAAMGEHPLVFADHAIALVRVVIIVAIWRAVLRASGTTAAGSAEAVLTYVILAQVLAEQLDPRTRIFDAIWDGSVATRLLRPVSMFGDYIAEMAGGWILRWATFSVPVLALSPLFGVSLAPASAERAALFVLSAALSVTVGVALDFIFALLVVRFSENSWSLQIAREGTSPLLSGALIPLPLLPWGLGEVLGVLPLASMVAAPLRIYTGDGTVATLLGLQCFWAVALWWIARAAWRRGATRMVSLGG